MRALVEIRDRVPTIDLSPGAPAAGAPRDAYARQAGQAFDEHGCVRLLHAFPPAQMAALRAEAYRRYGRYFAQDEYPDARTQGDRRTLVTLELDGPFGEPAFYANDHVYALASRVLGREFVLGHIAVILSRPGSADQFVHRDTPSLFGADRYDALMPTVGMAMVLPLVDIDATNGGTRVWPGSHRVASEEEARALPSAVVEMPLGSCLLFDVRTLHGGKGNRSDDMRSIIYGAYHRKWFRDWDGFEDQAPISLSRRRFRKVPPEYRHLLSWRFAPWAPWRVRDALERLSSRLPRRLVETTHRAVRRARR